MTVKSSTGLFRFIPVGSDFMRGAIHGISLDGYLVLLLRFNGRLG